MAFFQLVLKARKAEKARQRYEDEKFRSIEISRGAKPRYTLRQRLRQKKLRCKRRIKEFFTKFTPCPENSWLYKKVVAIRTNGTFENYIAKSFLGFLGGVMLTYIFFIFFVLQLHFGLSTATIFCTIIGVILTVGLAFSLRVRCVVFLLLPQFCSKRGRHALMSYVFILALTGPVKNILHNVGVLSESLTCGQEQLKEAVKMVIDLIKEPFYALREAISKVIKAVKLVVKNIKRTLLAIKRLVLSILRVIKSVFQWLGSVVNMCNKKLGTPYDRCQRVFEGAVADCKAKLGPAFGEICNLTYVVGALCYIVKPLDFICMLVSYVADTIIDAVKRKIKKFTSHMKAMFYVKVKFSHSFHFESNQSKTIGEVSSGILTEIRSRTDRFLEVFDLMSFLTTFFIFFLLLRVLHYRYKWLTSERFDNRYITEDIRKMDLVRTRQDKETVLPLNHREQKRYTSLTSISLIKSEKIKLAKSAVFLGVTTLKMIIFISIDYSLFWILSTIQYHGQFQTKVPEPNVVTLHVSGDGYLAQLYRSIVKAFSPDRKEMEINSIPCLPDPLPPNFDRYVQILFLIILCWIIIIFEPYGLRIRQVVMCHYYPSRAKQRAAWLYNHIIRSRGSFLKFARRQLRRKFGISDGERIETVTLRERFVARCPILNLCFSLKQNVCLLCGAIERSEKKPHIKCSTPGCVGMYCMPCYADLHNLCTICRQPVEYGDLSDISEEKDSSEDELPAMKWKDKNLQQLQLLLGEEEPAESEIIGEQGVESIGKEIGKEGKYLSTVGMVEAGESYADTDEDAQESESSYSYSYQDASASELDPEKERKPFKDIEAQKSRDDVTIQIFNEPSIKEGESSSESEGSYYLAAASRRKHRTRMIKESQSPYRLGKDRDSSSSIAATESWSTEEHHQEKADIEEYDTSEELLLKDQEDKKKRGRIKSMVEAVSRIPCLRGNEDSQDDSSEEKIKKQHSFMERIVGIFQGRRSEERQYRRINKDVDDETSSSSSSSGEQSIDDSITFQESSETENYEKNINLKCPHGKKSAAKELPRHLALVEKARYYEIDETTSSSRGGRRCVDEVEDINVFSDMVTSSDSRKLNTWNTRSDDATAARCTCATGMMHDMTADKNVYLLGTVVSQHIDCASKSGTKSDVRIAYGSPTNMQFIEEAQRGRGGPLFQIYESQTSSSIEAEDCFCECSEEYEEDVPRDRNSLPTRRNSELIEELKENDMMRKIREREASAPVISSSYDVPEGSRMCVKENIERVIASASASSRIVADETILPYQQTEAYKNVVSELRRRAILRGNETFGESAPSILFSRQHNNQSDLSMIQSFDEQCQTTSQNIEDSSNSLINEIKDYLHQQTAESQESFCICSDETQDFETSTFSSISIENNKHE